MKRMWTAAAVLALVTMAWAADTQPTTGVAATGAAKELKAIRYQRTGGFAGTNDVIEITPKGEVVLQGKLMGTGKGQLKPEQIAKLISLFADWPAAGKTYPAPAGSADGFEIKIRYGTVELSGSELNATLPAAFKAAREALEQIGRDVKGP